MRDELQGRINVAALAQHLAEFQEVALVYLFGSQVAGPVGPGSDYDVAVLLARDADEGSVYMPLHRAFMQALGTWRVDLVILNRAPIELAYAIIAQGSPLYQQDIATRVEYEAQVLSRYGDYLPILRQQRDAILRGGDDETRVQRYRAALGRVEHTLGALDPAR